MADHTFMWKWSDDEVIREHYRQDSLVVSDVQIELAARLEEAQADRDKYAELDQAIDQYTLTVKDLAQLADTMVEDVPTTVALLEYLHDQEITSLEDLKSRLLKPQGELPNVA